MVANITRTIEELKEEAEYRGMKKGIEQGIEQGKLDVAKALLDILDDETIAAKTGIALELIQSLRAKEVEK